MSRATISEDVDELEAFLFEPPSELVDQGLDSDNTYIDEDFEG